MFFAFLLEVLSLFYIVFAEFLVASTSVDSFRILKLFQIVQISSGFQFCEVCFTFFLVFVYGCGWLLVVGSWWMCWFFVFFLVFKLF